ncbi:MAG: hypothetical protein KBA31_14295 [Alphaproteobacteria bacterium]|nr:hypothetical protein [Alphaproteobacteria bacterium]
MPKAPMIRVRLSDDTSLDLPENEVVQVVTAGPSDQAGEGFVRLNPNDKKPSFGKMAKVRAAALVQGQHIVTYRGILQIEGAKRV